VAQRGITDDAINSKSGGYTVVCNDARMKEVYWGCFELGRQGFMVPVGPEQVTKPADVRLPDAWPENADVYGAGRGYTAYPELRQNLGPRMAHIDADVLPRALEIVVLATVEARAGNVLPPEEALPVYLRDEVARPKS
jgi:tRNA threonylcarbamoyladenosine biosynthesis protein TsaB